MSRIRTIQTVLVTGVLFVLAFGSLPLPTVAQTPQAVRSDTTYGCLMCHAEKRRSFSTGVHSDRGIHCDDCHGGNPEAFEIPAAHRGRFLGNPSKLETIELCSSCHSDADQMRQFGLPSDQLAEYRTSRHGQLLLQRGSTDAPTCTDCHDAHTILPPEDARSNVYPTNIPVTCARCHEDVALMAKYGLATDQFTEYRRSAHGTGLFDDQNFASPTCTGCHGSHAALPPGVLEVVNVCDKCHVLVGRAYAQGPHGVPSSEGGLPGCLGCHSNHGTDAASPDGIVSTCIECHEPGSPPALVGAELQEGVLQASRDLVSAEHAIAELERSGVQVSEERFRYTSGLTSYRQMALVQHSLDLEALNDLAREIRSNSELVRSTAEVRAEERWEHKLFLVPVWFLALAAIALASFKLRDLSVQKQ